MKDVQAGVNAVRGANGDMAAVTTGAKSIEAALASVEAFWKARKDDAAVKMSGDSALRPLAVAKAAEGKDAAAVGEATKAIVRNVQGLPRRASRSAPRQDLQDQIGGHRLPGPGPKKARPFFSLSRIPPNGHDPVV